MAVLGGQGLFFRGLSEAGLGGHVAGAERTGVCQALKSGSLLPATGIVAGSSVVQALSGVVILAWRPFVERDFWGVIYSWERAGCAELAAVRVSQRRGDGQAAPDAGRLKGSLLSPGAGGAGGIPCRLLPLPLAPLFLIALARGRGRLFRLRCWLPGWAIRLLPGSHMASHHMQTPGRC